MTCEVCCSRISCGACGSRRKMQWRRELRQRIWGSHRRTMLRQRCLPKSPPSARITVFACSHTVLCQFQHFETLRPVCPQDSCKVRISFAACHCRCWKMCACFLHVICKHTHCDTQPFVHLHLFRYNILIYPQSLQAAVLSLASQTMLFEFDLRWGADVARVLVWNSLSTSRSRVHDCCHHTACTSGQQDFFMCPK